MAFESRDGNGSGSSIINTCRENKGNNKNTNNNSSSLFAHRTSSLLSSQPSSLLLSSLSDSKGRIAKKLRISLTDKCNFSCLFCMPSQKRDIQWIPGNEILTFPEIERISRILIGLGIEKIRLTGGEPLLRENIENLVDTLAQISGLKNLSMTTNGFLLAQKAKVLRKAGLGGITISLHSLKPGKFSKIAGSGTEGLGRVLEGIDASIDAGFKAIKINAVIIREYNDDEIINIVEFARSRNLALRFIEFMPLDGSKIWQTDLVITGSEIIKTISKYFKVVSKGRKRGDTSVIYEFEDGIGEVGLISPISLPFCDDCDRIRLTADGKLLTCLFDSNYYDLKPLLRHDKDNYSSAPPSSSSALSNNNSSKIHPGQKRGNNDNLETETSAKTDDQIADFIINSVRKKPPGIQYASPLIKNIQRTRPMYAIGG